MKAELLLKQNIENVLKRGTWDKNPRPAYSDGTPARTQFITDVFEKYEAHEVPITETRRIAWKTAIRELMWIYQDQTSDLETLEKRKVMYWRDWEVDGTGSIGEVYGKTVSNYDLIGKLLQGIETDPFGRRHILNLWQEADFHKPHGLKPCAFLSMYSVRETEEGTRYLDASLTLRSSDYLTAGHINRMQYRALQMMIAKHVGIEVGTFAVHTKNLHIYDRHMEQATIMLETIDTLLRQEKEEDLTFTLDVPAKTNFFDITEEDFKLTGYRPVKHEPRLTFDLGI